MSITLLRSLSVTKLVDFRCEIIAVPHHTIQRIIFIKSLKLLQYYTQPNWLWNHFTNPILLILNIQQKYKCTNLFRITNMDSELILHYFKRHYWFTDLKYDHLQCISIKMYLQSTQCVYTGIHWRIREYCEGRLRVRPVCGCSMVTAPAPIRPGSGDSDTVALVALMVPCHTCHHQHPVTTSQSRSHNITHKYKYFCKVP